MGVLQDEFLPVRSFGHEGRVSPVLRFRGRFRYGIVHISPRHFAPPEKEIIDNTLGGMPDIAMDKTVKSIESMIKNFPMKKTNATQINKLKDLLSDTK